MIQVESIRSLATRESDEETNEIYIPALVAVGIAFRKLRPPGSWL
jgi:hypothetical protein